MKKILIKTSKAAAYSLLGIFLAFAVYANLEPTPMHVYVKPNSMTILKEDKLKYEEQANVIQTEIGKAAGSGIAL